MLVSGGFFTLIIRGGVLSLTLWLFHLFRVKVAQFQGCAGGSATEGTLKVLGEPTFSAERGHAVGNVMGRHLARWHAGKPTVEPLEREWAEHRRRANDEERDWTAVSWMESNKIKAGPRPLFTPLSPFAPCNLLRRSCSRSLAFRLFLPVPRLHHSHRRRRKLLYYS